MSGGASSLMFSIATMQVIPQHFQFSVTSSTITIYMEMAFFSKMNIGLFQKQLSMSVFEKVNLLKPLLRSI